MSVSRVLVANRGEIAVRVLHACHELGLETVLAVSDADRDSLGARLADRAVCIGPARATDSYLNVGALVTAATATGCDALHPGYGFLAESPALAEACAAAGIVFVGPTAEQMRRMGDKIRARAQAGAAGVPTLPGSGRIDSPEDAVAAAHRIGLPLIVKASAGGGGRGMKIVTDAADLPDVLAAAAAEAKAAFGDPTLYVERFVADARHVEVQLLGDRYGSVVHLGERDCSLQRRNQKVVEEAPAPGIPEPVRAAIRDSAVRLAAGIGYENAGTVEFLYDAATHEFFFLEMNTRIQVEHPVTELITGIDLVQEQFRIAAGEPLRFGQDDVVFRGHAVECRVTAEVAAEGFRPNAGRITCWEPPAGPNVRVDTHCYPGYLVPMYYDSLLAKVVVYGSTREEAVQRMRRALHRFRVEGIETTVDVLGFLVGRPEFGSGAVTTHLIADVLGEYTSGLEVAS
ncbi:acetyl-CoA carboxylase biotin carboxylase subunit [Pseudonocardia adelaidensis]|uniref:biotin carboxylase n=1 Tax=Pseudonocardia adelaidensis TaxID=648754 RepID=A0ABP9NH95_9PSEU